MGLGLGAQRANASGCFHKGFPKPQTQTLRTLHEQRFADLGIPIQFISVPPKGLFCVVMIEKYNPEQRSSSATVF